MIYALTVLFTVLIAVFIYSGIKEYSREQQKQKERMELKKRYRKENDNETY